MVRQVTRAKCVLERIAPRVMNTLEDGEESPYQVMQRIPTSHVSPQELFFSTTSIMLAVLEHAQQVYINEMTPFSPQDCNRTCDQISGRGATGTTTATRNASVIDLVSEVGGEKDEAVDPHTGNLEGQLEELRKQLQTSKQDNEYLRGSLDQCRASLEAAEKKVDSLEEKKLLDEAAARDLERVRSDVTGEVPSEEEEDEKDETEGEEEEGEGTPSRPEKRLRTSDEPPATPSSPALTPTSATRIRENIYILEPDVLLFSDDSEKNTDKKRRTGAPGYLANVVILLPVPCTIGQARDAASRALHPYAPNSRFELAFGNSGDGQIKAVIPHCMDGRYLHNDSIQVTRKGPNGEDIISIHVFQPQKED